MLGCALLFLLCGHISAIKTYKICSDLLPSSVIVDLREDGISRDNEQITLLTKSKFELDGRLLYSKEKLENGEMFRLEFLAVDNMDQERILVVYVTATDKCHISFSHTVYHARITNNKFISDAPIRINATKNISIKQISPANHLNIQDYIQNEWTYITIPVENRIKDFPIHLGVYINDVLASVTIIKASSPQKIQEYDVTTDNVISSKAVLKLGDSNDYWMPSKKVPFYVKDDVIFPTFSIYNGHYEFTVIDSENNQTPVKLRIGHQHKRRKKNVKRGLNLESGIRGQDMNIFVKENSPLRTLKEKIPLNHHEKIESYSPLDGPLMIRQDGSLELIQSLNFESENQFQVQVQISGGRTQVIHIHVLDVPEPPAFTNSPLPFRGIIPNNAPIGCKIFEFNARNEQGEGDNHVNYDLINTEPKNAFTVDRNTGSVRTALQSYNTTQIYRVFAQTHSIHNFTLKSEIAVLELFADDLPPQFMQNVYSVVIPENSTIGTSIVQLLVHEFPSVRNGQRKTAPSFSLIFDNNQYPYFTIDPHTGVITLQRPLDFDEMGVTKTFKLTGVVTQEARESKVPVEVTILDVNDNKPIFTQSLYTAVVKEDVTSDVMILKATAIDKDSSLNSHIDYAIDHPLFRINENGEIYATKKLDADGTKEKYRIYKMNVTATDRGNPPLSDMATIHLRVENTNDEAPVFLPTAEYQAEIAEDAQGFTPVIQVQATDIDTDRVRFYFNDHGSKVRETEYFQIDEDTGLIRLLPNVKASDLTRETEPLTLEVIAEDDGSCCQNEDSVFHRSMAKVYVSILDVNNNRPEFPDCQIYSNIAKLEEGTYYENGPVVLRVKAIDNDTSSNGDIVYSLYYSNTEQRHPFVIHPITGDLKPAAGFVFDREQRAYEEVTVKASDKAERPLIGFCQFTVQILDVNDNAPQFDRLLYETTISRMTQPHTSILSVIAEDADSPPNANITYRLLPDLSAAKKHRHDDQYFDLISEGSPEIGIKKEIPASKTKFVFLVEANDNGRPNKNSTVQVYVNVHEENYYAPQWQNTALCPSTVHIDEDIQKNSILFKCLALSGHSNTNPVTYSMKIGAKMSTNSKQTFREFKQKIDGLDWVIVRNMDMLDYEKVQNYTLTLTATDIHSMIATDRRLKVIVKDKNDGVPRFSVDKFTGTVEEEKDPDFYTDRKPIVVVKAEDSDSEGPQSEIRYSIVDDAKQKFRIDEITGAIYPIIKFDREKRNTYIFDVEARDNMNSSLPGIYGPNKDFVKIHISVSDVNDNPPFFDQPLYELSVKENADPLAELMVIRAQDKDEQSSLRYNLMSIGEGEDLPFGVRTETGTIFVKNMLDYETKKDYYMIMTVTDGVHNSSINVTVNVEDVNDNPPVFEKEAYEVTIEEENTHVPVVLFKVKAFDTDDITRENPILYQLEGQGVGEFFVLDPRTNDITVMKPLDRDPPTGIPVWEFVVRATDDNGNGLSNYATVRVNLRDINDNSPVFLEPLIGYVDENQEPGRDGHYVMTVVAEDNDDPASENGQVECSIGVNKEIAGQMLFRIDAHNGKIFLMRKVDRELLSEREFVIEVIANDLGYPSRESQANVTIKVLDLNDNPPFFEHSQYNVSIPESQPTDSAVFTLVAFDLDIDARNNVFSYELLDPSDQFYMTTEMLTSGPSVGILRVKKALDFEDPEQRHGFPMEVRVFDGRFYGSTKVYILLEDENDNPPIINGPKRIHFSEGTAVNSQIGQFSVTDQDSNDKSTYVSPLPSPSGPLFVFIPYLDSLLGYC
uniref:Cadherin domain-containing protein n=1 Tax=Bursaphelenchus xylophilus TaxID=6326 RepID=A0A1I7SAF6_BURXY